MRNLDQRNFDPVKVRKSVICSFPVEDSRSSLLGAVPWHFAHLADFQCLVI